MPRPLKPTAQPKQFDSNLRFLTPQISWGESLKLA